MPCPDLEALTAHGAAFWFLTQALNEALSVNGWKQDTVWEYVAFAALFLGAWWYERSTQNDRRLDKRGMGPYGAEAPPGGGGGGDTCV